MIEKERVEFLFEVLEELPENAREVLKLRFGLGHNDNLTLQAIGKKFKCSKQNIKQIELQGLEQLRDFFKERGLL